MNKQQKREKQEKQKYQIIHNDEIDLRALWMVLWTNKLSLVKITSGFFVLGIVSLFFSTTLYYSNATVIQTEAEASSSMTSMLSLASSVGMDIGEPAASPTVDVLDFVASRRMLNTLLEKTWETKRLGETDLITYWEINDTSGVFNILIKGVSSLLGLEPKTEEEIKMRWFEAGRRMLSDRIVARHTDTGLLMVEVWMEESKLAQSITTYVIEAIEEYTNEVKANRWRKNIDFLVQRLAELGIELSQAESDLTGFQKENRRISDSPELMVEMVNLRRKVEIKTALYLTLQNEYEFARIEETKDITGIIILDPANYPVEPDKPQKLVILIVSIVLGFIISIPGYLIFRAAKK